ncbi:NAD-dependent dehydratase [Knoellia flava TL1]|uniref:NAD-dependent dehydratase n=2 Tax=Knoellia flava TaxID=913969 RepID=A0A8H9FU91_9MICO|nr:NAD(P)H-binding protein [Knoellia flava]KGN33555.1 NAD-dependent dehydratase [Knoellia flava TL1]GGB73210.1 NAD-dependent dehydratase [Knoellia flava]
MAAVTIIGGHGKVALRASRLLADAGHDVTSWVRNPDHVPDVEATGATAAVHDAESMSTEQMARALAGADVVVWSAGAGGGSPERTRAVDHEAAVRSMDAAATLADPLYVMVSYFGAGSDHGVPQDNPFFAYAEAKAAADEHLRGSDLRWVVLGPSTLTDEPGTGQVDVDAEESGEVTRDDVAAVIAHVVEHPELAGRTIRFNNGDTPIAEALDSLV